MGDSGPYILYFHGTPGGYDMPLMRIPGMRTIIPSRPGYLRTPLEVGRSPEEQATAFSGLLDELGIESVVVLGGSGGGPYAISFAELFPERTDGLITIAARSLPENLPEGLEAPIYIRSDFIYWALTTWMTSSPELTVKTIVPDPDNQNKILEDPAMSAALADIAWSLWPFSIREEGWFAAADAFLSEQQAGLESAQVIFSGSSN